MISSRFAGTMSTLADPLLPYAQDKFGSMTSQRERTFQENLSLTAKGRSYQPPRSAFTFRSTTHDTMDFFGAPHDRTRHPTLDLPYTEGKAVGNQLERAYGLKGIKSGMLPPMTPRAPPRRGTPRVPIEPPGTSSSRWTPQSTPRGTSRGTPRSRVSKRHSGNLSARSPCSSRFGTPRAGVKMGMGTTVGAVALPVSAVLNSTAQLDFRNNFDADGAPRMSSSTGIFPNNLGTVSDWSRKV